MTTTRALFRYWGSKPGYLVSDYLLRLPKNSLILDLFGGSGSIVFQALSLGHRCIYADVNPYAFVTAYTILSDFDVSEFVTYAEMLLKKVYNLTYRLYTVRLNGKKSLIKYFKWIDDKIKCAVTVDGEEICSNFNVELPNNLWISPPRRVATAVLKYSNGAPFDKMRYSERLTDFFTFRNLVILSYIHREMKKLIRKYKLKSEVSIPLVAIFASIIFSASKMAREGAGSWGINSYWVPRSFIEKNPIELMRNSIKRVIRWKNKYRGYTICLDINEFKHRNYYEALLFLGSAPTLIKKLSEHDIKADAIVTDPPFLDEVQYFELSYIINVWIHDLLKVALKGRFKVYSKFYNMEIVVNRRRGIDESKYIEKLRKTLRLARGVLRSSGELILLFHEEEAQMHRRILSVLTDLGYKLVNADRKCMMQRHVGDRDISRGRELRIYRFILNRT